MIFSVDTNFFLQCRDPKDLPWREVTDEAEVVVIVSRAVQQEIDRLKQDGKGRRSQRARKASSLLRQIVQSEELALVLREANPKVRITLPPPLDPARPKPASLDMTIADDRIIEETLAYRDAAPGSVVALLTHDTNPLLTARQHGLCAIAIPDTWLLAPEPDERDKTIQQLKQRVEALETTYPKLSVQATDSSGKELRSIELEVVKFAPLSQATVDSLVDEVRSRCPLVTNFKLKRSSSALSSSVSLELIGLTGTRMEPPTEEQIRKYTEEVYPAWLDDVREFFKSLAAELEKRQPAPKFMFALTNSGSRPAENVLLDLEIRGGLLFEAPSKTSSDDGQTTLESLRLPDPPKAPRPRRVSIYDSALSRLQRDMAIADRFHQPDPFLSTSLFAGHRAPEHDRHTFYWKPRRPRTPGSRWLFECDEFRHQLDPEIFDVSLIPADDQQVDGGAVVCCRVSAKNVSVPLSLTLPVSVSYRTGDTEAEARNLVRAISQDK